MKIHKMGSDELNELKPAPKIMVTNDKYTRYAEYVWDGQHYNKTTEGSLETVTEGNIIKAKLVPDEDN